MAFFIWADDSALKTAKPNVGHYYAICRTVSNEDVISARMISEWLYIATELVKLAFFETVATSIDDLFVMRL
ncbi:MAG: hypothetical protein EOO48_01335 [Flavobacterium sp.]|nr:MAG: hypothetical protein EOO48_01335 [Flavobacterium sp.]